MRLIYKRPECLHWLARFNLAFPPCPKEPRGAFHFRTVADRSTYHDLKDFFHKEFRRLQILAGTGEVEEKVETGTYRLPTSLSGRLERV